MKKMMNGGKTEKAATTGTKYQSATTRDKKKVGGSVSYKKGGSVKKK